MRGVGCARRGRSGATAPVWAVILALAVGLWGCSRNKGPAKVAVAPRPKASVAESSYLKGYRERLQALLAPVSYHYDPTGKPDPFRPFITGQIGGVVHAKPRPRPKAQAKRPAVCSTPLACMDVGQLTLVAIVDRGHGRRIAMAQDAAGRGYFIEKGTRIGFHGGVVVAILPGRVVIHEKGEDIMGRPVVKERVMVLHPEEE